MKSKIIIIFSLAPWANIGHLIRRGYDDQYSIYEVSNQHIVRKFNIRL